MAPARALGSLPRASQDCRQRLASRGFLSLFPVMGEKKKKKMKKKKKTKKKGLRAPCEAWHSLYLHCLYLSLAFRVDTRSLGVAGGVVAILCSVLMPYEDKVEAQFGKLYVSYLGASGIREATTNFGERAVVHHFPLEVDGVKAVEQVSKLSLYDDKAEEHSAH